MPRAPRIEFPGACYHVMNRGDHFEPIFQDDTDRQRCWEVLAETCQSAGWWLHSFVFMPNHYHLLIETRRATLVKGMQYLNSTYTHRYNGRHKTRGHLFQGRYKAILVDAKSPSYFLTASDYIHLNPWRARLIRQPHTLFTDPWNSAGWLTGRRATRPPWLKWERVYGELNHETWDRRTRRSFLDHLTRRLQEKTEPRAYHTLRRGWCLGSEGFMADMKDRLRDLQAKPHEEESWAGPAVEEAEQDRAARLLAQGRRVCGGTLTGWERYLVAKWVRTQTKVNVTWLAGQVGLRTRGGLAQGIYRVGLRLLQDRRLRARWDQLVKVKR